MHILVAFTLFLMMGVMTVLSIGIYMIPTVIAIARHHHRSMLILIINILTGWTVIGWIACLVVALMTANPSTYANHNEWERGESDDY